MSTTDIKRVQFMGGHFFFCSAMSTPQETSNAAMAPIPDIDMASDGKDEQVVNLAAIAREATAKLEKDLADPKAQNDEITQKKQEWVDRKVAERKCKEDEDTAKKKVEVL